jgi:hypothetical protein
VAKRELNLSSVRPDGYTYVQSTYETDSYETIIDQNGNSVSSSIILSHNGLR